MGDDILQEGTSDTILQEGTTDTILQESGSTSANGPFPYYILSAMNGGIQDLGGI
jgi:hypothetical protein